MVDKFFIKLYNFFSTRQRLLLIVFGVVFLVCIYLAFNLKFSEDISDFLPQGNQYSKVSGAISQASGNSRIFVYFSSKDSTFDIQSIKKSMDFFVKTAKQNDKKHYFNDLSSKVDQNQVGYLASFVQENIAYFVDSMSFSRIDSCLVNSDSILTATKKLLQQPVPSFIKQVANNDPLNIFTPILVGLKKINPTSNYSIDNGYVFDNQYKRGVVFFNSPVGMSESGNNAEIISALNDAIKITIGKYPDTEIRLFGPPVVAVCNAERIKKDTIATSIVSTLLILVVLWFSIRSVKNLTITALTLAFSFAAALSAAKLIFGEISLISVGISAVFTGIALNYPLHFITHFYHTGGNMSLNMREISAPLTTGNITTVVAFYSLMFADSPALKHLGFIGGSLLAACILVTLTVLPHVVNYVEIKKNENSFVFFDRIFCFLQKKVVVIIALVVTPIFIWLSLKTEFDGDMHQLNYMTPDLAIDMQRLVKSQSPDGSDAIYVVSTGESIDKALENHELTLPICDSLIKNKIATDVVGIGNFLPSENSQRKKIARWNNFLSMYKDSLLATVDNFVEKNGSKNIFSGFSQLLDKDFEVKKCSYFAPLTAIFNGGYIVENNQGFAVVSIIRAKPENTSAVENAFASLSCDISAFDEHVVSSQLTQALSSNFNYVLFAAAVLVFGFLTYSMRSEELAVVTFIPLTISWFWIMGIMFLFDIKFNIVNIILATFIFGQGDDYAVFITEGLMYEYATRRKVLGSFKRSVAVSSVIMFIGIGSLIFAKHPAMQSLGIVVVIGMFSVVVAAYIFPPLVFNFLIKDKKSQPRLYPYNFRSIFVSAYYFLGFVIACLRLTMVFVWFKLTNKKGDAAQLRFHEKMQKCVGLVNHCPRVKLTIDNSVGENFEKPAVIIANHESALDILCIQSLFAKILFITNDKQQKNILYGRLLKIANFYPASLGYDVLATRLKPFVNQGYSVMIFPEGTRSCDAKLHRFHQGAFYLARQLQVDVLPIALYGLGSVLKKEDLILRPGQMHVKLCSRMPLSDKMFAETNLETARNFRHYFISELKKMSEKIETSEYFKPLIIYNYIYKGAEVYTEVIKSMKKSYDFIDNFGQEEKKVLFKNCGYGYVPLLFALVNKKSVVFATDNDENKIIVAENCAVVPKNLTYLHQINDDSFDTVLDCDNL